MKLIRGARSKSRVALRRQTLPARAARLDQRGDDAPRCGGKHAKGGASGISRRSRPVLANDLEVGGRSSTSEKTADGPTQSDEEDGPRRPRVLVPGEGARDLDDGTVDVDLGDGIDSSLQTHGCRNTSIVYGAVDALLAFE